MHTGEAGTISVWRHDHPDIAVLRQAENVISVDGGAMPGASLRSDH